MKPFKYCIITVLLFTAFSAYGQRAEELVAVWHSDSYVDSQFNYYYRVEVQNESQSLTITSLEVEVQFGERFPANKYNPRLLYTTKIIQVEIRPNSTKYTDYFKASAPPTGFDFRGVDVKRVRFSDGSVIDIYSGHISSPYHTLGRRTIRL